MSALFGQNGQNGQPVQLLVEVVKGEKVESVCFLTGQGALACFVKALISWKRIVALTNVQVSRRLLFNITFKEIF